MWGKRDLCERKTKEDDESDSGDVVLAAGEEEQNHMREGGDLLFTAAALPTSSVSEPCPIVLMFRAGCVSRV